MKRIEPIILVAAVGFYALAMTSQGILPLLEKDVTRPTTLKTIFGKTVSTPKRDELEAQGRRIYIREGCWYCHSQYIRPVNRDTDKWGPVTQAGEISDDLPQMFGTRRIGPELSREGNRRSNEWHYAHHWNPRSTEPDSMMPSFTWLYADDGEHDGRSPLSRQVRHESRRARHQERARQEWRRGRHPGRAAAGLEGAGRLAGQSGRNRRRRHRRHA